MSGGVGSRFWPFSKEGKPKQFLDFFGTGRSLLQSTFDRFKKIVPAENIYIVTNDAYAEMTMKQLPELKAQPRPAHGAEGLRVVPVRLREHGHAQALGLEHAADDRRAEARMIDICVAADDERIVPPPAALVHLLGGDGQKITPLHVSPSCG